MYKNIIKFIRDLYEKDDFISLHEPTFTGNEKKYLNECIDTSFVSSVGKFVDQLEEIVASYTGARKTVTCVNGTNALYLALKLVDVNEGDEVLTQALTFIATANAISYCGAHPVFLDVDKDTMGLSPQATEKWLTENTYLKNGLCYNKNTGRCIKACVPMHTFGHPVHIDELIVVCKKFNITLVEDAAESLGSFYKEKHTGTFGKIGILSFNGNKTITTGGGGMLLFNDEDLAKYAKHLTTQAKIPHAWEFAHDNIGFNYRMPNLNAALGCAQFEKIDKIINSKRDIANKYQLFFSQNGIRFFTEPNDCRSNYWLNALILENKNERDTFLKYTNENGIMTRPIWKLMNHLQMFKNCQTDDLKNAIWLEERVVNIPSSPKL